MPRTRKKGDVEQPSTPAWMVTYGDMMTLLMVFFVLIVSFSTVEIIRFRAAMGSFQGAIMPWQPKIAGKAVMEPVTVDIMEKDRDRNQAIEELQQMIEDAELTEQVEVYEVGGGVRIVFSDPVLFDEGKDDLKPEVFPVMRRLVSVALKANTGEILIEGHTDDTPIHTSRFPSNWELSAARALKVLKFLQAAGFPPQRLVAVGYGEYRPRVPMPKTATTEQKAVNRRVEVFLKLNKAGDEVISQPGYHGGETGWED
ncbi:MAG TPA: hypothetical protein ENL08_00565 [Bacteroidetes bacterium]|nr:hypothetical protein [Bacteroidota bacterium]